MAANFLILQDVRRRSVGQNPALIECHNAIGVAVDDLHVMLDEYEGRSIRRDGMNHALHGREFLFGGNAGGWLVHQQQSGAAHHCHGDIDQLAHAAGKLRNRTISQIGKAKAVEQLDGIDIGRRSARSVARLGISRSFQIPQLFVELTAAENLTVAISGVGMRMSLRSPAEAQGRHDQAVELLERFGLADLADRPVSELAGGVRKLIDIAMALVRRPKLLLLDEPTSGVSAEEKFATMERVIHAVAPDAATLVFVEHDMEIVSRYADRVVAFYQGRILADGAPSDVLKDQEVRRYVTGGVR